MKRQGNVPKDWYGWGSIGLIIPLSSHYHQPSYICWWPHGEGGVFSPWLLGGWFMNQAPWTILRYWLRYTKSWQYSNRLETCAKINNRRGGTSEATSSQSLIVSLLATYTLFNFTLKNSVYRRSKITREKRTDVWTDELTDIKYHRDALSHLEIEWKKD